MKKTRNKPELASKLASLPHMDRETLVDEWKLAYGHMPPAGLSQLILSLSLAYRWQEKSIMRLPKQTSRVLHSIASDTHSDLTPYMGLKAGTRLLREWRGVVHEITILDKGVLYNGKMYKSLTGVAVLITGARWSGPRFFGIKAKGNSNE